MFKGYFYAFVLSIVLSGGCGDDDNAAANDSKGIAGSTAGAAAVGGSTSAITANDGLGGKTASAGGKTASAGGKKASAGGKTASAGGKTAGAGGKAGADTKLGAGGKAGAGGASQGKGTCCPDGNCICREPVATGAPLPDGPFATDSFSGSTGTIYYPTDAEPPFGAVAVCGGFTNMGPEMSSWGPFYASWGIVTIITSTGPSDPPNMRGDKLNASIEELRGLNTESGSPLFGKLADRYGTSGYSMGGGGTTYASTNDPTLKTSVGLAPWGPVSDMTVPTLFLCGNADAVAGARVPTTASGTPSMQVVFSGYTHFNWFGPTAASGYYALAWQKVYLEGDERWKPLLSEQIDGVATMEPNL